MVKKTSLADGPHIPPTYEPVHQAGLKALQRGEATAHQQQLVLKWLIEQAAGTYQMHFYPESDRWSTFALGRAFVGQQIVKLLNLDQLVRGNANVEPNRPDGGG